MKKIIIMMCLLFLPIFTVKAEAEPVTTVTAKEPQSMQEITDNPYAAEESPSEETIGFLYIRPDLPENFRGSMELELKNQESGKVYTCKIEKYNYPYSTWSPTFYWKTIELPYGRYEVIRWVALRDGKYLYTTVPESTIDIYPSWSGMFFPSVYETEISEEEAQAISFDGEEYVTQEPKESEETIVEEEKRDISGLISRIIFAGALVVCIVCTVVYYKKYKIYK